MMSPPNPRKKPLSLGVAWQNASADLGTQVPSALAEFKLSMPSPVAEFQALPKFTFTSSALCAWANNGQNSNGRPYHVLFISNFLLNSESNRSISSEALCFNDAAAGPDVSIGISGGIGKSGAVEWLRGRLAISP